MNKYESNEYNFLIQYPQTWKLENDEDQEFNMPNLLSSFYLQQIEINEATPYLSIKIFDNGDNLSLSTWWNNFLVLEDNKKKKCREEEGPDAPCLFLRDLIEDQENINLFNFPAKSIRIFRFDSSQECDYIAFDRKVYEFCYDKVNPNDSNFETNQKTVSKIFSTVFLSKDKSKNSLDKI